MGIALIIIGLLFSLYGSLKTIELPLKTWLRMTAVWGGITEENANKIDKEFKSSVKTARLFLVLGTLFQVIGSLMGYN